MLPFSCTCVLLRKLWTLSYVTWRIFPADTFPLFVSVPLFCYIIHKITTRFRHWSSRGTPGTPVSTFYKHCMVSSHMYWDAHCKYKVVFVRSTEQPVFCVVQQNYVWKLLYTLKSFNFRMSTNMVLYYSLEYSQYISRCFIVHRRYVANSKLVKYEYGQYYS